MENVDLLTIISIIMGAVATLFGGFWAVAKGKVTKIVTAAKELIQVGEALDSALADNAINKEEVAKIKAEWVEAKAAIKAIVGK